jgi:hypothetical protein
MIFADFLVRLWRREGKKHGVPREPSAIPMLPGVVAESEFQERVRAWITEAGGYDNNTADACYYGNTPYFLSQRHIAGRIEEPDGGVLARSGELIHDRSSVDSGSFGSQRKISQKQDVCVYR